MKKVVIHQPLFFPWIGMFEQMVCSDIYLHYDDAIIPKSGGLTNRIKIKTSNGTVWLTVPIIRKGEQCIRDVKILNNKPWKNKHFKTLQQSYARAPYVADMLDIVNEVYDRNDVYLMDLNIFAIEKVVEYYCLDLNSEFTSKFNVRCQRSEKVFALVKKNNGNIYITGHGARKYLDHDMFESNGIRVEYMDYKMMPYPQLHGDFNPYVSILDLIANTGQEGKKFISPATIYWKVFNNRD